MQNNQPETPNSSNPWLNSLKLPGALTIGFSINQVWAAGYAYFLPTSAALPASANDIFTLSNGVRAMTDDLSKVIPMNILMAWLMPKNNSLSLPTKIKYFMAPLLAFNMLALVNHLINFSKPDTATELMLRAINAVASTSLLDYVKNNTVPMTMFIEMVFIVFMKQNGNDVSALIQSFLDDHIADLESDAANNIISILSNLTAEVIIPTVAGAAAGLTVTAAKSFGPKAYNTICSAGSWCCSFWGSSSTNNNLVSTNNSPKQPLLPISK